MNREIYQIAAAFDTETTNILNGADSVAFPVCYISNDLRGVDLAKWKLGCSDITIYRRESEYLRFIRELISWGCTQKVVPVVCAYNLMFDLQTLMHSLSQDFAIEANAQSSTSAYTVDLYSLTTGKKLLRFWDTFFLDMRGLKAMGEVAGLPKAVGDWDYSLIRTPETPLTAEEEFYAKRDVEVIPAYLRYLLNANDWLKPDMLGSSVLTKTSLVRQMAKKRIANKKVAKENGKKLTLGKAFQAHCLKEFPKSFEIYALRKACFRGGFTFTSAKYAHRIVENVASVDASSMHHAHICGHYVPQDFRKVKPKQLQFAFDKVIATPFDKVLAEYDKPFAFAFHARIRFKNIRLKKNSAFAEEDIALIPQGKFQLNTPVDYSKNELNRCAEKANKLAGWKDTAKFPVFAFSKLYSAEECTLHINEVEAWTLAQVYEWDSAEAVLGEATCAFKLPPDYVTLQSMSLFELKNDMKQINKRYEAGKPYTRDIPDSVPESLAEELRTGSVSNEFIESYYVSTVKGMFNSIYGTMAQDVMKPSYTVENGELMVDQNTVCTKETFEELAPENCKVLYTYGMRIVGWSRLHLVIAIILLKNAFGAKVKITGGDTDSVKMACDTSITDADICAALKPIAEAAAESIAKCTARAKEAFPELASNMEGVGSFDVETCDKETGATRYLQHMEAWNKARISFDGKHCHVTCAGLSRPENGFHIETFCDCLIRNGFPFHQIAPLVLGYNVHVQNEVCHALQKKKPKVCELFEDEVTDYLGNVAQVDTHQAIALYPVERVLGESFKQANHLSLQYMKSKGFEPEAMERFICFDGKTASIKIFTENGIETYIEGNY